MDFIQFGLNLSAPTHQSGLQFGLLDFLTPPAPLIIVLRFVFDIFAPQRHLFELKTDIICIGLTSTKSENIHNGRIYKVVQNVSVVIWKEAELNRSMLYETPFAHKEFWPWPTRWLNLRKPQKSKKISKNVFLFSLKNANCNQRSTFPLYFLCIHDISFTEYIFLT